ncbi:WhiB family transcriptional regulator [Streptomyces sp. NPDC008086]|uniref:WhiB family transcriptional regulator n=1 Tax=Streptomyces sp. NPDC008086 TaxID=3364807 RepID=UPI0036EE32C8
MQLHDLTVDATTRHRATPPRERVSEDRLTAPAQRHTTPGCPQRSRRCPVRQPCLDWAVEADPVEGIWGGTTEQECRALKRRLVRPSRNVPATAA